MSNITNVKILIPVDDFAVAESYYLDVLSFYKKDGLFFSSINDLSVGLMIVEMGEDLKKTCPPKKRFPIFSFIIEKNFLSYCMRIYQKGGIFHLVLRDPGGRYYARICDPDNNHFEIFCDSDEDDEAIDTAEMPFFYSY